GTGGRGALPFHARALVSADVHVRGGEEIRDLGEHVAQEVEDLVGDAQDVIGDPPDLAHAELLVREVPQLRVGGDRRLHVPGQIHLGHDHDPATAGVLDQVGE